MSGRGIEISRWAKDVELGIAAYVYSRLYKQAYSHDNKSSSACSDITVQLLSTLLRLRPAYLASKTSLP
jgi:hypothetical protein